MNVHNYALFVLEIHVVVPNSFVIHLLSLWDLSYARLSRYYFLVGRRVWVMKSFHVGLFLPQWVHCWFDVRKVQVTPGMDVNIKEAFIGAVEPIPSPLQTVNRVVIIDNKLMA